MSAYLRPGELKLSDDVILAAVRRTFSSAETVKLEDSGGGGDTPPQLWVVANGGGKSALIALESPTRGPIEPNTVPELIVRGASFV